MVCRREVKWYSRGIAAVDEDILVVNGSQQGIDLICKALVGKNTVVLAEAPSYAVALHCFQRAGGPYRCWRTGRIWTRFVPWLTRHPLIFTTR